MAGAPASISVVNQPISFPINSAPGVPLVAKVVDANGNPVSGVTVTFMPQGNQALCSFAGGVNTAVTDVNGLATSAAITANGIVGSYQVQAWVGTWPPIPGAVGPATFTLSNSPGYAIQNKAAIQAAWTTAKAQLATILADAATLANDLAALEASCDALYSLNAGDVGDWLRQNARQGRLGFQPRVSSHGDTAPALLSIWAPDPKTPRDTTSVDQRPVTITSTAQSCQLS
jgi:hypothetical protein